MYSKMAQIIIIMFLLSQLIRKLYKYDKRLKEKNSLKIIMARNENWGNKLNNNLRYTYTYCI